MKTALFLTKQSSMWGLPFLTGKKNSQLWGQLCTLRGTIHSEFFTFIINTDINKPKFN